jgi:hypothetical protein
MRVILVAIHPAPSPQSVPLANAFLQSYLNSSPAGNLCKVKLADFFLGQECSVCVDQLTAVRPTAIGFSLYVWNRLMCSELAGELRRRLPGINLFAGGPEAAADPAGVLAEGCYDFLVSGEGEQPFAEACLRMSLGASVTGIPGVATLTNSGVSLIPAVPFTNLDDIPSPWLGGVLNANSYPGILWQLSRGCGFSCDFCFDSRDSHGVRRFSLERIEAELRHFASLGVSQIFVLDSTFNQDVRRAKTILRLIHKFAPRTHFHFEVRSEFIDREMAGLFVEITCSLQIGLQSAAPQVLKNVGRNFRRDDFITRTMLLNDSGAVFGFDLIYGLPGDTLDGFHQSLNFALALYPNHLDIFPLAILPGTALAGRSNAIGLRHLPRPPYTMTDSATFSSADMSAARKLAVACDIFYTRGRAVAWFNGVIEPLKITASQFLQCFGDWLEQQPDSCSDESELSDSRIWELQRAFLATRFSSGKLKRFLPAALDLVDYHYHYAAALMMPLPQLPSKKSLAKARLLHLPLRLAPSAHLAEFSYNILEILDAGVPDLRAFADGLERHGSMAAIYPAERGICTESLDDSYFSLLKRLDGTTAPNEIIGGLGLAQEQALRFLIFTVSEGIVLLPEES